MNRQDQVLLGRRKDNALFGLPGGKLEFGESIEECAARELAEETQVQLPPQNFRVFKALNCRRPGYHCVDFFAAVQWDEVQAPVNAEPEACEGWEFVSWDTLPTLELFWPLADILESTPQLRFEEVPKLPRVLS